MPLYRYVDKTGALKTITANDPNIAISSASDIDPTSGVQLIQDQPAAPATPKTPAPAEPAQPAGDATATLDAYNSEAGLRRRYTSELSKSLDTTQGDIQQSVKDQMRSQIDARVAALNGYYNELVGKQSVENEKVRSSARATALNSGLGGSTFADAQDNTVGEQNLKKVQLINAERQNKIQELYGYFDEQEQKRIEAETARVNKDQEKYFQSRKELLDSAQNSLKTLSSIGLSFSDLYNADPEEADKLLKDLGMSKDQAQAYVVAQGAAQGKYLNASDPKIVGNKAIFFKQTTDPKTGKMMISTDEVDIPDNGSGIKQTYATKNGIVVLHNDGTYKTIGTGGGSTGGTTTTSGKAKYTANDVITARDILKQHTGEDNYVDPAVYIDLYKDWQDAGLTLAEFKKEFPPIQYINPANTWVPSYFSTAPKKSTTSTLPPSVR